MCLCKELLLSFIVVMHISLVASEQDELKELRETLGYLMIPLCHLKMAQNYYVQHLPPANSLTDYVPPEGITFPVGNTTEEIKHSMCTIIDYLEQMPNIARRLLPESHRRPLITNTSIFLTQFKMVVEEFPNNATSCSTNVTIVSLHDWELKEIGLRIVYFARKWVEKFTNTVPRCEC